MISGNIKNSVMLDMLTQKWERKKSSGNILSKNELNERENMTSEQRILDNYKELLENGKEDNKKAVIANKISCGEKLTPEEEQYLASYDPQGLADYRQTQAERKAYEIKLKNCKTEEEVHRLKTTTLGHQLSSLKKIVNNPNIPLSEKLKKAQQILGKTKNVQEAEEEFIEKGKYKILPSETEETEDTEPASKDQSETDIVRDNDNTQTDIGDNISTDIEDIYNHLKFTAQLELGDRIDIETQKEKNVGKKMDFSV